MIALLTRPSEKAPAPASVLSGGLAALMLLFTSVAPAQVVINEVMADNRGAVENGNDNPDYVELRNLSAQSASLAGMSLSDDPAQPRAFVFPSGISIPANGYLVVWCDSNFGSPGLHAGFALGAKGETVRLYAADGITLLDELVFGLQLANQSLGRVPDGSGAWTLTQATPRTANIAVTLGLASQARLNEWLARPAAGDDWIELYNGDGLPVAVGGLVLTDRATGIPTNRPIPALSFIPARGFIQLFASDLQEPGADHLDFRLSGNGETLTLYQADGSTVIDRVVFGGQADDVSQGRAPDGSDNIVFFPVGRATPGMPNVTPLTSVVISEVLTHTDPPLEDAVELHNPTDAPVDISHWWLSDSAAQPKKYQIPAGTIIPSGGFKVLYQYQFDTGPNAFTFNSAEGDDVFLSAGDASGNLTGQQTFAEFGALRNGVSAGRHVTSTGADFVPLSQRSFGVDTPTSLTQFRQGTGLTNVAPRVGPVVITEILFRPPDEGGLPNTDDEFIELHNPNSSLVTLYDPVYLTNAWRLRDGVSFDFPLNLSMPAQSLLLLVSFDPAAEPAKVAAFRSKFSVPAEVPVLGPYNGKLSDTGETLELLWPDEPQGPDRPDAGFVPYELVERIAYAAVAPWPAGAAGTGQSLQRSVALAYGNEPQNWFVGAPTPGRPNAVDSDGDGMPDAWETAHGLDPGSSADALLDPDGDGLVNLDEYRAGTDPNHSQSVLRINSVQPAQGGIRLTFQAVAGKTYAIEFSDSIAPGVWQSFTNLTASVSSETEVTVPAGGTMRLFRVGLVAGP